MMSLARRSFLTAALGLLLAGPWAAPAGAALSPDDSAAIQRAIHYLNGIDTLKARFVQISSNGAYAEGSLLVDRPGKLRFDYDPPYPILMIANGLSFLYYDRELKQASFLPLWETPLWFLIRDKVKLTDDLEVLKVVQKAATLRITMRDRKSPEAGTVTLVFSDRPMALKKWEMVDSQGIVTQVSLVDPKFGVKIDDSQFDYGNLQIQGSQPPKGRK